MSAFRGVQVLVTAAVACRTRHSGQRRGPQQRPLNPLSCGDAPIVQLTGHLIMGLIRQAGHEDIAATIRKAEYDNDLLLALLRLTTDL
jgi:hypothetical protein